MADKNKLILFDIDGTLSDPEHRRIFACTMPKNWLAFEAAIKFDPPNIQVIFILHALFSQNNTTIVLVTARPERCREQTEEWLKNHDIHYHDMVMRGDDDRRADFITKEELLSKIREKHGEPFMVFDDRLTVLDKCWRKNGIFTLDIAQGKGDF